MRRDKNRRRAILLAMAVVLSQSFLTGCVRNPLEEDFLIVEEEETYTMEEEVPALPKAEEGDDWEIDQQTEAEREAAVWAKGYDLPVEKKMGKKAEKDCLNVMKQVRDIYRSADKGEAINAVVSGETIRRMQKVVAGNGRPVSVSDDLYNMKNYKKMRDFLKECEKGIAGDIVLYEVDDGGGIDRRAFHHDGTNLYVLNTDGTWNDSGKPVAARTWYTRVKEWKVTKKGWFFFEYCVPEPPEVSEAVDGNRMIRILPQKKEYRRIAKKYLTPIGYQGNDLFSINWDEKHLKKIDFNAVFPYLYQVVHEERFPADRYAKGIPRAEFEEILSACLPVDSETLRRKADYDEETQVYGWNTHDCSNHAPLYLDTSISEVISMEDLGDGTTLLTIDAVCERTGDDKVMRHQLRVQFTEGDGVRYLGNQML